MQKSLGCFVQINFNGLEHKDPPIVGFLFTHQSLGEVCVWFFDIQPNNNPSYSGGGLVAKHVFLIFSPSSLVKMDPT